MVAKHTASIADCVSVVVASPQWLAGDRDIGRRRLAGPGAVLRVRVRALAGSVLALGPTVVCLCQGNLRRLTDSVVVCRASVASIVTSGTVAATSARACAVRCRVGDIGSSSKLLRRCRG
jgi:hypothetical protein